MRRTAVLLTFVLGLTANHGFGQDPQATPKRSWLGRVFHPFHSESLPEYHDARLRGLVLNLELSPQPIKLYEVRQLAVRVTLTNLSKRGIDLQFPTEQRIEIYLRNSSGDILTKWSDNHAFEEKPATILINAHERIEYNESIATRELTPNTVFVAEVFFPRYPELRIRKKFLTAP